MGEKGSIALGAILVMVVLLTGLSYGGYLLWGAIGNSYEVDTSLWGTVSGQTIGFNHPKE